MCINLVGKKTLNNTETGKDIGRLNRTLQVTETGGTKEQPGAQFGQMM